MRDPTTRRRGLRRDGKSASFPDSLVPQQHTDAVLPFGCVDDQDYNRQSSRVLKAARQPRLRVLDQDLCGESSTDEPRGYRRSQSIHRRHSSWTDPVHDDYDDYDDYGGENIRPCPRSEPPAQKASRTLSIDSGVEYDSDSSSTRNQYPARRSTSHTGRRHAEAGVRSEADGRRRSGSAAKAAASQARHASASSALSAEQGESSPDDEVFSRHDEMSDASGSSVGARIRSENGLGSSDSGTGSGHDDDVAIAPAKHSRSSGGSGDEAAEEGPAAKRQSVFRAQPSDLIATDSLPENQAKEVALGKFGLLPGESFVSDWTGDLRALAYRPVPEKQLALCKIFRHNGTAKYPSFSMAVEDGSGSTGRTILVAKRQKHGKKISYLIAEDPDHYRDHEHIGKLKACSGSSKYVLYNDGDKRRKEGDMARKEIADVVYTHKSRNKPRGLYAKVPYSSADSREHELCMVNALPSWDPRLKVHSLRFNGRATEVSVKNFKLIRDSVNYSFSSEEFFVRFGKVGKDSFNLDFRAPLTPLHAFSIALTAFEGGRA